MNTIEKKEGTINFCNYILDLQSNNKFIKDKIIMLNSLNEIKIKINDFIMFDELKAFIEKEASRLHLNKEVYFNSIILSAFDIYDFYKNKIKNN